jgi:hypothetical protein
MSNPDDYGVRRVPVFLTREGHPQRGKVTAVDLPRDLDEARPQIDAEPTATASVDRRLADLHDVLARSEAPTRLQAIAEAMLELRWEEFVSLAEGVQGDAKVMHAWAKENARAG